MLYTIHNHRVWILALKQTDGKGRSGKRWLTEKNSFAASLLYYLDIAYLRYPLIHNAHMCKDIGYYYEGWDFKTAEDKLIEALKFHDDNMELYDYQVDRIFYHSEKQGLFFCAR